MHGAPHILRCAWQCYMILVCICQPSMLWKLGAWLWWHHLIPYSITKFHVTIGGVLLCHTPPQLFSQTCLEFCPDFLSSSSCFSFHSRHMCLEEFLESATRLRISWASTLLDVGWICAWFEAAYQSSCCTQSADTAEQPPLQESPSHP